MSSSTSFLEDELRQNKIAACVPELTKYQAVMAELSYTLSPRIHEGKLQPYGFIIINDLGIPGMKSICDKAHVSLADARRVADGCRSFSIFKDGRFGGVAVLDEEAETELQLVQLQQAFKTVICTTDTSGVTKIFCDAGIFIHQYRNWQRKPPITSALQNVHRCAPQADLKTLQNLLEFCFHDLSPRKIGATLVWCLDKPSKEELENMQPAFVLQQIEAKVGEERSTAVLRHLLTYTDGAAILNYQAEAVGVGAQLKYSEVSKRLIEAQAGTRHTSAQRFSYDFAKGIIFVVSSDGPVTVFSDGMSVTGLRVDPTDRSAVASAEEALPEEEGVTSCANELNCPVCRKKLKVQENEQPEVGEIGGQLFCPVCENFLYSTRCANLDVHVVKELQDSFVDAVNGR